MIARQAVQKKTGARGLRRIMVSLGAFTLTTFRAMTSSQNPERVLLGIRDGQGLFVLGEDGGGG